jgi:hypothetical protein
VLEYRKSNFRLIGDGDAHFFVAPASGNNVLLLLMRQSIVLDQFREFKCGTFMLIAIFAVTIGWCPADSCCAQISSTSELAIGTIPVSSHPDCPCADDCCTCMCTVTLFIQQIEFGFSHSLADRIALLIISPKLLERPSLVLIRPPR